MNTVYIVVKRADFPFGHVKKYTSDINQIVGVYASKRDAEAAHAAVSAGKHPDRFGVIKKRLKQGGRA